MSTILLLFTSLVGAAGLLRPAGYIKAPTLIALVFAAWFAPQLIAVANDPFVPYDAVLDVALLAILCLFAAIAGWRLGVAAQTRCASPKRVALNVNALVVPVVALTAFTTGMNLLLEQMRASMAHVSQWSGPITIVAFFAQLRIIALVLSLLMVLQHRSSTTVALAAINLVVNVPFALILLRRSEMIDIGLAVLGSLWFARRWRLPLPIILAGGAALSIVVFSIGPLRGAQKQHEVRTGETLSLVDPALWRDIAMSATLGSSIERAPDVYNAVYSVALINDTGVGPAFGAVVWNGLIHQYVPAQLVGHELKQALMFRTGNLPFDDLLYRYGFDYQTGTTSTGVGSAYREFRHLGFVFYVIIGYILARLYARAIRGDVWMQTAYLAFLPFALTSITHGHDRFFVVIPIYASCIWGLWFISTRSSSRRRASLSQQVRPTTGRPSKSINRYEPR